MQNKYKNFGLSPVPTAGDRANLVEAVTHLSNCSHQIKAMRMAKRYVIENSQIIVEVLQKSEIKLLKLIKETETFLD